MGAHHSLAIAPPAIHLPTLIPPGMHHHTCGHRERERRAELEAAARAAEAAASKAAEAQLEIDLTPI